MQLHHAFDVAAPVDDVWMALLDLERVANCFPGATVARDADGTYRGSMKLKIGPVRADYEGTATLLEVDQDRRRAVIEVSGRDARGQGTAQATVISAVSESGAGAHVEVETALGLTGPVAQFGRGIVTDVGDAMVGQFASRLGSMLAGGEGAESQGPADGQAPQAELDLAGLAWKPVLRMASTPLSAFVLGVAVGLLIRGRRRGSVPPWASWGPPPGWSDGNA